MRTAIASKDSVSAAAHAIIASGNTPTVERVRDKLGGGSYSTINRLLSEHFLEQRAVTAKINQLPSDLAQLARDLAVKLATDIYIRVAESTEAQINSIKAESEAQVSTAQDQAAEAIEEIDRLEARIEALGVELFEARTTAANERERASTSEGKVAAHEYEITRLGASLIAANAEWRNAEAEAAETRGQLQALREQVAQLTERLAAKGGEK